MILRRCWATALVASLSLTSAHAVAAPSAKERAEAKALVAEAKAAAKRGSWAEASKALARADELDPTPQTKLDLARALVPQKKLVAASKALHAAMDGAQGAGGKRLAETAKKLLEEIEPRVPWIQVTVTGPSADKVKTAIDGEDVDATSEVPIDPGEHVIVAEADGYEPAEKSLTIAEGKHEKVTLALEKSAGGSTATASSKDDAEESAGGGSALPAILAFGVGAAGIGVGAVFGVMAFSETSKVEDQCDGTRCPPEVQSALDVAKTNGTISTVAFIVGGVGVVSGVVLLVTSSGGAAKPASYRGDRAAVRPVVGPGHVGVAGRF